MENDVTINDILMLLDAITSVQAQDTSTILGIVGRVLALEARVNILEKEVNLTSILLMNEGERLS